MLLMLFVVRGALITTKNNELIHLLNTKKIPKL